jgi:glycosyltransferase involved in cell wall biosynthesis
MRVLHVVHSLPPYEMAGTPILTYQLATAQARQAEVFLFSRLDDLARRDGSLHDETRDGVTIRFFNRHAVPWSPLTASYRDPAAERHFRAYLEEVRPDVVHFQHLLGLGLGLLTLARDASYPCIFSLHDFWTMCPMGQRTCNTDLQICDPIDFSRCGPCVYGEGWVGGEGGRPSVRAYFQRRIAETPGQFGRRPLALLHALRSRARDLIDRRPPERDPFVTRYELMAEALRKADLVIGTSAFICQQFRDGFRIPDDRLLFLANGMDFDSVRVQEKTLSPRLRFGFVGSIIRTKGVDVLVQGFVEAARQNPDIELHVHGAPNRWSRDFDTEVRALAAASGVDDRIIFHGAFDNRRIGEIHRDLDLLVVPSIWYENSPLVLNEAAMTRTPVIASDRGGMREFVDVTGYGRTFRLGDPHSLASVIADLASNPEALRALSGRPPPIKPIERSAAQTLDVYHQVRAGTFVPPPWDDQLRTRGGVFDP